MSLEWSVVLSVTCEHVTLKKKDIMQLGGVTWRRVFGRMGVLLTSLLTFTDLFRFASAADLLSGDEGTKPQRMWEPGEGSLLGQDMDDYGMENVTLTNQTAQLGSTTFLHCHVRQNAHKRQVSWLRRRDFQLLTSGLHTYSRDQRFRIVFPQDKDDWALQIKFVRKRDQGAYECQVSTVSGRYGYVVNLAVVVPEAVISGSPERHVQAGSTISLLCVIHGGVTPPQFILWYHNGEMVNYDQSRGGTTVTMDQNDPTTSRLTINNASTKHSGNYTCTAPHTSSASASVFVTRGDKTAAIQRLDSSACDVSSFPTRWLYLLLLALSSTLQAPHSSSLVSVWTGT